jgi:hypothetical protein
LVLRNENDAADVESAGTRLNDILRASQPVPAAAASKNAAPKPVRSESSTVTSIRGISKRQEQP